MPRRASSVVICSTKAARSASRAAATASMSVPRRRLALAVLIVSTLQLVQARADDADLERALQAGEIVPLNDLLARIRKDFAGRLLQVELEQEDIAEGSGWVYEAKVLTPEGNVLKLEYDARSLELLEIRGRRGHTDRDHDND